MTVEEFKKLGPYVAEQDWEDIRHDGVLIGKICVSESFPNGQYQIGEDGRRIIGRVPATDTIVYIGPAGRVRRGTMDELKGLV